MNKKVAVFPETETFRGFKTIVTEGMFETLEQNALFHYNQTLGLSGEKPVTSLPDGTMFTEYNKYETV